MSTISSAVVNVNISEVAPSSDVGSSISARAARVNAHLAGKTTRPVRVKSLKFCFAYFGRTRYCDRGDDCGFNHDEEAYKLDRGLKDCPNCDNYCKLTSNQCSECVNALYEARNKERADRKAEIDAREDRPCKGFGCKEVSKYNFCYSCNQVNKRYIVDPRPTHKD